MTTILRLCPGRQVGYRTALERSQQAVCHTTDVARRSDRISCVTGSPAHRRSTSAVSAQLKEQSEGTVNVMLNFLCCLTYLLRLGFADGDRKKSIPYMAAHLTRLA